MRDNEPLADIEPLSAPPPLPVDEPPLAPPKPSRPPTRADWAPPPGPFDDPFSSGDIVEDAEPLDDEPTAFVARPKRIEVDGAATLRVRGETHAVRVYNLSATGAFVSVDLEALPALGEEVELSAIGYRPARARVMHGRPRDPIKGTPAGLGLELYPDPATRQPATIPHVVLATAEPELRRALAAMVAGAGMLPVPATDVVAAYVATQTMPVSVLVIDPAVQPRGDWRDLPEGFGVVQRGTPVIAIQEVGRRLRGLPAWIVPCTLEGLGRTLRATLSAPGQPEARG